MFYRMINLTESLDVVIVLYTLSVCVSSAFADHQNYDWHSYRFEQAPVSYRIKEFHFLPMSPSLLWRKIVISALIKKLKQTSVNV